MILARSGIGTVVGIALLVGAAPAVPQPAAPQLANTPVTRLAAQRKRLAEATRIKAQLRSIRNTEPELCANGALLHVGTTPTGVSPSIEIVAARTALRLTGPQMDRIAAAELVVGSTTYGATVQRRGIPGSCGPNSQVIIGREGMAEVRFDAFSAGVTNAKLRIFARESSTLPAVASLQRNLEATCAPNCDLRPGAPLAAEITVRIFPRPSFTSATPAAVEGTDTAVAGVVRFQGQGLGAPAAITLVGRDSTGATLFRGLAPRAEGRSTTQLRARVTADVAQPGTTRALTIGPALTLKAAGNTTRTVEINDTRYPGASADRFASVAVTFTRALPDPRDALRGIDPEPLNVFNQPGVSNGQTGGRPGGGQYVELTSLTPCKDLGGPAGETGFREGDYTFPDVRWGVRNTGLTTFVGPATARLVQGDVVQMTMEIANLAPGATAFETFVRPTSLARVARLETDKLAPALPEACFGVVSLPNGDPWNDNPGFTIKIDGVSPDTNLRTMDPSGTGAAINN